MDVRWWFTKCKARWSDQSCCPCTNVVERVGLVMHCMGCSALLVGILLLLSSVFFVTGSAYDVPVGLDVLLLSTYLMLSISLIFAGAGLHWKHNDEIHQVCRQGAKASFLMGLTAGIFSEMLCNVSDGKR